MRRTTRGRLLLAGLLALGLAVFVTAPMVGMKAVTVQDVLGNALDVTAHKIFWEIRVPRVLVSFLAGAGLGLSGMAFQAMFRNVLATPYTLGVASGASFGAALCVRAGITLDLPLFSAVTLCAFAGAMLAVGVVYGISRSRAGMSPPTLLLAGVAVSFLFSSLILFVQYTSGLTQSFRIVRWLMGSIDVLGYRPAVEIAPFVITGSLIVLALYRELDLMLLGDELSMSRGLNVDRTRKLLVLAVSLMVGGIVAVCGPIGFVGMMAPHMVRLATGADHKYLGPATFLFGGAFLTICDTMGRTLAAPAEIPVGVVTALLGGPFFLWLLLRRSGSGWWGLG
ncbi:MAG TPA: iron ABC transporter permease [Deltaproteobacteria bacterium]|nr:iron ABC transporter permease [Deltaproteobacteria bacterium]HOM29970.1 iron ABC transporter permease [Deltaproteobacteria bacterium]HPP81032.1 iron ABC transporter permease [Deltaproteobacteria bacterium]